MISRLARAVICTQAFATVAVILRGRSLGDNQNGPYRQSMRNIHDVSYTGVIELGGQKLNAVIDTGSFDLVVISSKCKHCCSKCRLYDDHRSSTFEGSDFTTDHEYGSGSTSSYESYDQLTIGTLAANKQVFWEVYAANMPILSHGHFEAILGVGPPTSSIKFAEMDARDVHDQFRNYQQSGYKITDSMWAEARHYDQVLDHAKKAVSVVKNLAVQSMSICMGQQSGSEGYAIWNDAAPRDYPDRFVNVRVVGDYYWSTDMTDVKLGARSLPNGAAYSGKSLGCSGETCNVVIDSGTSLLAVPQPVVRMVDEAIDEFVKAGGSCDDLSAFPDLEFKMGGQLFSLPPEAYIGKVSGGFNAAAARYLPHVLWRRIKGKSWGDCESLLMSMYIGDQGGPTWILGMPFFRKYYSNFQFVERRGVPQARNMAFAVADSSCEPASPNDAAQGLLAADRATRQLSRLNINASEIRVPSFAGRVQHRNAKSVKLTL